MTAMKWQPMIARTAASCPMRRRNPRQSDDPQASNYEECDDGNSDEHDVCLSNCLNARCGDGVVRGDLTEGEPGFEACDDGNVADDDGCVAGCLEARCGDGMIRLGIEDCDDGNDVDSDGCSNSCELPGCGDGIVQEGEDCDDGNQVDEDACLNNCREARCGDGILRQNLSAEDPGYEACDDGNQVDQDACKSDCSANICGDGVIGLVKAVTTATTMQRTLATIVVPPAAVMDKSKPAKPVMMATGKRLMVVPVAAPSLAAVMAFHRQDVQPEEPSFEECDDGNGVDNDGCTNACRLAQCGDGIRSPSKSAMTAIASTTMSAPTTASEPVAVMRSSSRVRTATTATAMMMTPVEATAGSLAAVTASPAGT